MADAHYSRSARRFTSALQVAKLAGVSRSAVSRAFTDGASIAPETREKVMQAAEALGYHVNDLARGLLARRSRLVGRERRYAISCRCAGARSVATYGY